MELVTGSKPNGYGAGTESGVEAIQVWTCQEDRMMVILVSRETGDRERGECFFGWDGMSGGSLN